MKISLKWINEYVDVKDYFAKPEALAEILTRAGLEVEEIRSKAKDFQMVVTGLILEKEKHPNADKLSVCKVTTGEGVVHQIVCGAQNHKANDKVIVALPGAVLPGNFAIKKAIVRDVESGGMLCSMKELGLPGESQGIAILPENAPIGKSYAEYAGFDDVTFELKVTANRADCLSHYGLAREVACLLVKPLKVIEPKFEQNDESSQSKISLDVRDSELCPRYTGRYIQGVKVQDSPAWLKARLEAVGLNSINNVVDATNYVMMELGQPLHAFDAGQIQGKKIIVEKAKAQEKFVKLDGAELTLTGDELMIKDGERSVCMAGVVGGKNSGVSDATQDIFLEAAFFAPQGVRKASRQHGLNTDSSYRFTRGVDPEGTMLGLNRATEIILKVAGGSAFAEPHNFYPKAQIKLPVSISIKTVSERLGYTADAKKFEDFMARLGCKVEVTGEGEYKILPPSFRFDLEADMDLVEEYARLYGYEHIPETIPVLNMVPTRHDLNYQLSTKTSRVLRGQSFNQAMNLALVSSVGQMKFLKGLRNVTAAGLQVSEAPVKVLNPLGEEQDSLRMSLSYSLMKNLSQNFHQGNAYGRLFEIGKAFTLKGAGEYPEHWRLGLMAWGHQSGLWQQNQNHPVVFEVKAAIESLLEAFCITSYEWVNVKEKSDAVEFLHRGQNALLKVEGKVIGFIGTLHPVLLEEEKIRVPAAIAEFDLEALYVRQPKWNRIQSISRFPKIERDLALLMKKAVRVGDVIKDIQKEAGPLLREVEVFDVYAGDKLEVGQKSVAFRLTYQDRKDTLRDEPVNQSIQKVLESLKQKFEISVR